MTIQQDEMWQVEQGDLLGIWKKLKFDHTNKRYMHNLESVLKNEMPKLHCDSEIQTDHLILARRTDLVIMNAKKKITCRIGNFVVSTDYWLKLKKSEKKDKNLDLAWELKEKYGT